MCNDDTCPAANRTCSLPGDQARTATCVREVNGNLQVDANACTNDAITTQTCTRTCYNAPQKFIKSSGDCSAASCDVEGSRSVTYTPCSDGRGCQTYPGITGTTAVTNTEICPAVPCDACASAPCVAANTASSYTDANGVCVCECSANWIGSRCHLEAGVQYDVLDASGATCSSGVTDMLGNCCAAAVDACGYCEDATVDGLASVRVGYTLDGVCCSSEDPDAFLTGDFSCCESPEDLDECGVCGGAGDTCTKLLDGSLELAGAFLVSDFTDLVQALLPDNVAAILEVDGITVARRLLQTGTDVQYGLPPGVSMSSVELVGAYLQAGTSANVAGDLTSAPDTPELSVEGEPGNGLCETGELPGSIDCPEPVDCPLPSPFDGTSYVGTPTLACSGKGVCNIGTGTCACSLGYTGLACDSCDTRKGYSVVPTTRGNACSKLASDFPDPPPGAPGSPTPPGTPPSTSEKKGLALGALLGIVLGSIGGVVVMGGALFYFMRVRGAKEVSPV
jgi:hypothetical protein